MHAEGSFHSIDFDEEHFAEYLQSVIKNDNEVFLVWDVGDELAGFLTGSVTPFMFSPELTASTDLWYVSMENRGRIGGVLLLYAFEEWADEKGAVRICIGAANGTEQDSISRLLRRFGYQPCGELYKCGA